MKKRTGPEPPKYWFLSTWRVWLKSSHWLMTTGPKISTVYIVPITVWGPLEILSPRICLVASIRKIWVNSIIQSSWDRIIRKKRYILHTNNYSLIVYRLEWKFSFASWSPGWGQAAEGSHEERGIFQGHRASVLLALVAYDFSCFQCLHLVFYDKIFPEVNGRDPGNAQMQSLLQV